MRQLVVVLFALVLLGGCGLRPPETMTMPGLDSDRAEHRVQRLWARNSGAGIGKGFLNLSPAVTADRIYAADHRGRVYARDRNDGSRLWRMSTGDRIATGLYAGFGMVVYGTREGEAVALDAEDGAQQWRAPLGSELLSAPAVNEQLAVFQTLDGRVVALERETGERRWTFDSSVPILILRGTGEPLIAGNRVYAGLANGKVVALDTASGAPVWERRVSEPSGRSELERLVDITNNLVLDGSALFAANYQGNAMRLERHSGGPLWNRPVSTHAPIAADGGSIYVADNDGNVWALDARSGNDLWRQDALADRGGLTGVVVHDGYVVTGDSEGYLHWLDGETGHLVMRHPHQPQGLAATPVVRDGVLYALGSRGWLAAYELREREDRVAR